MTLHIRQESPRDLAEYDRIPIRFPVTEVFDAEGVADLLQGGHASATPTHTVWWKDYDEYVGNRPAEWPRRFDLAAWTILAAFDAGERVGGAVVIAGGSQIELLGDCVDGALLWDLRVAPDQRARGIGSALLRSAERHAARRGARALCAETQNINVPACRFYARSGFQLERATADAYPELPGEIQLLWRKSLTHESVATPAGDR